MAKYDYLIVGAGLFGAVFAYEAGKRGKSCLVIDKRPPISAISRARRRYCPSSCCACGGGFPQSGAATASPASTRRVSRHFSSSACPSAPYASCSTVPAIRK